MTISIPVSVLVATRNEEVNLADCLASVAWSDDVVVVDSASADRTVEIAHEHGATVVQFPGVAATGRRKRTWAIDEHAFRHAWILVLDADERVTDELREEIAALVAGRPEHDAYRLAFRLRFMGGWIRHCGWYPSYIVRLFRHGHANYERPQMAWDASMGDVEAHERIVTDGTVGTLANDLLHEDYNGLHAWIEKHNRYSTWEASRRVAGVDRTSFRRALLASVRGDSIQRRRARRSLALRLPGRPVLTFVWMYVVKRGFLDGRPGFVFCVLHAVHQLHIDVKADELTSTAGR